MIQASTWVGDTDTMLGVRKRTDREEFTLPASTHMKFQGHTTLMDGEENQQIHSLEPTESLAGAGGQRQVLHERWTSILVSVTQVQTEVKHIMLYAKDGHTACALLFISYHLV